MIIIHQSFPHNSSGLFAYHLPPIMDLHSSQAIRSSIFDIHELLQLSSRDCGRSLF